MSGRTRRIGLVAALLSVALIGGYGCDSPDVTPASGQWREEVDRADGPLPAPAVVRTPGMIAVLPAAPTLVGGRLRLMGLNQRVWTEPLGAPSGVAAFWSYRRPDADLAGYQVGRAAVVTLWDDETLVGLDVATGAPVWHTTLADDQHAGRGKATVTGRPPGLVLVTGSGADVAVLVRGSRRLGVDAGTGRTLWTWDKASRCPVPDATANPGVWESGGYVVLDATCAGGRAALVVLDPRTGRATATLDPALPWPAENGTGEVSALGCTGHHRHCGLVGIEPSGSTAGLRRPAWRIGPGGRAVPVPAQTTSVNGAGEGLYSVSDFLIVAVSPAGRYRWRVTGQEHDLDRPQFGPADADGGLLWVGSYSWNGGPAALAGFDPGTGRLRTCAAPPRGRPIRWLDAQGGFLVLGDARELGDPDVDVVPPDAFQLVAPDTRPHACPR